MARTLADHNCAVEVTRPDGTTENFDRAHRKVIVEDSGRVTIERIGGNITVVPPDCKVVVK